MADILFPDGTTLADLVANLNSFATLPTTSRGAGEIIHYSGDNTIRWNSQTTNPTTNPTWSDLSAGGWDGNATSNLDMNEYIIQNCEEIEFYNTSVKSGEISTFHGAGNETFFIIGSDVIRIESHNGYDIVLDSGAGDIDADSNKIKNVLTPAAASDAANKGYADALPGTNVATFKINQDNAGAEASAIEFDRGSEATAARIHWSEANDRFIFEEVTGSTLAEVRTKQLDVQDQINLDDTVGTVMIKKNDSTGDMELQVASGDSIVFKAV
jgi:hypothetical protein